MWSRERVSSEMTHQPPALPCIAQGRPRVRYARREGIPHKEKRVEVCRLLTVVSRGVQEKRRVFMEGVGRGWAPTLPSDTARSGEAQEPHMEADEASQSSLGCLQQQPRPAGASHFKWAQILCSSLGDH